MELEFPHVFGLKIHGQRRTTDGAENHRWGRPDQHLSDLWLRWMDRHGKQRKSEEKQKHQYSTLFDVVKIIKFNSLTSILYNNGFVYLVNIKVCLLRCGVVIVCCFLKGGEKKQQDFVFCWLHHPETTACFKIELLHQNKVTDYVFVCEGLQTQLELRCGLK